MSNKILFVFEGEGETQIFESLRRYYLNKNESIYCVFKAEIYQLFHQLEKDIDIDTFNLLKEKNSSILNDFTREDFAEIYLFFDFDGHSSLASNEKLNSLLKFFDNETEKGKLYISYPMVESLKHIEKNDDNQIIELNIDQCKNYKDLVNKNSLVDFQNYNKYSKITWNTIIKIHLSRANYIVFGIYSLPNEKITQIEILRNQEIKYINPFYTISVLNSIPLLLQDYYGNEKIIASIQ